MKETAKKALKNPLIYGSTIVVFGGLLSNFFNFLYNLFMSRTLSLTEYGILASLISLITFPALLVTALNPVIVRFAGDYFAKKDILLLRGLYYQFFKFLLVLGSAIFLLFLIFLGQIASFFHIRDQFILLLTDFIIFLAFVSAINISFLQAKLAFGMQIIINLVIAVLKLILGIIFVVVGYSVGGATMAILIASLIGYFVSFAQLRFIFSKKTKMPHIDTKAIFSYGIPSALTLFGLISFISSDIILVKHFFNPIQAGQYAGLSLIGRIIFFVSAPIGTVMFPIIVQKYTRNENYDNTFKMAVGLVLAPSILLTLFYSFFPKFSVLFFLKNPAYLAVAPLVGIFGLYITFYSVLYLFANFYLSIKKTNIYLPILIASFLQIILIVFYHNNFWQIILISFVLIGILLSLFLVYYPYATKK